METQTLKATIGLISFMVTTISVSAYTTRSFEVKEHSAWIPVFREPIQIIEHVESRVICLSICGSVPACKSAFKNGTACAIFSATVLDMSQTGGASQAVGFVRPQKMVLQISRASHYTYTQSQTVCQSLDGVLASRADIQKIYEDGTSFCKCGWIKEGYGVYPMTYSDHNCGGRTGLIDCLASQTLRAWCKFV